jgi:4-coumarate--CoA ligase (photoactive yellow protein activation family)
MARQDIQRVLFSLVRTQVCNTKNISQHEFEWPGCSSEMWLDEQGIDLDSMERLNLAGQILQLFDLYDSGIGDRLLAAQSLSQCVNLVQKYFACKHMQFSSSGSQGDSSVNEHSLLLLRAEALAHSNYLTAHRLIVLVPVHHIYGFIWGVLLPDIMKIPVLEGRAAVRAIHQDLQAGDLIIGLPLWWKHLAQSIRRFPADVQGITSTAPLAPAIWDNLLDKGLAGLHEIYGASELAGIGYRQHWSERYELLECWQGLSSCGDHLLHVDGRLSCILPDHLDFATPRCFSIAGRKDRQLQVAGYNVSPENVAARLKAHVKVKDCQVRLMHPDEGDRLKALVVTTHELNETERSDLLGWCVQAFLVHERPHLTFASETSVSEMGKSRDWYI